jgi:hypothetical protein
MEKKENAIMGNGNKPTESSRRAFLKSGGTLLAGGALGGLAPAVLAGPKPSPKTSETPSDTAPPLPWKWAALDPMEAATRAYRLYFEVGG